MIINNALLKWVGDGWGKGIALGCWELDLSRVKHPNHLSRLRPLFTTGKWPITQLSSKKSCFNGLNVRKKYIHFFDVDWDVQTRQPVPKALVQFRQKPIGAVAPIVFITNRTLSNLTPAALPG